MRTDFIILLVAALLLFALHCTGATWSTNRDHAIDWTRCGFIGGIPERTTIYTNLTANGNDYLQLTDALANCPSNQLILLAAGNYILTNYLTLTRNGVCLRGAGASQTTLTFTNLLAGGSQLIFITGSGQFTPTLLTSWTNGYGKGTNSLMLSNVTGLATSNLLFLDQTDDYTHLVMGYDDLGRGANRTMVQVVRVTNITGTTVMIDPPIYMTNWNSIREPMAYWPTRALEAVGIENLRVTRWTNVTATYNFGIEYALNCWIKGVNSSTGSTAHVFTFRTKGCEIRECLFDYSLNYGVSSYGIELNLSSDTLIEDNQFFWLTTAYLPRGGSSGNVFGYNFITNSFNNLASWQGNAVSANHRSHPTMNLFEGNVLEQFYLDFIHGSSSHLTFFRNRVYGNSFFTNGVLKDNNTYSLVIEKTNRYNTVVGNFFGYAGYHTNKEYNTTNNLTADAKSIYRLGYPDTGSSTNGGDAEVMATLYRHANELTATNSNIGGLVMSNMTEWVDAAERTLPASLYRSTKPNFMGILPWPSIGPDVDEGSYLNGAMADFFGIGIEPTGRRISGIRLAH